jgi:hypothetical protein
MKRRILPAGALALAGLLAGCADYPITWFGLGSVAYDGPGTFEEFMAVHRQCQREAAMGGINASPSPYTQAAGVGGTPSCSAIANCMSRNGYSRAANGRLVVPAADVSSCMGG